MPFDNLRDTYGDVLSKHGFVPANHQRPVFFPVRVGEVFNAQGHQIHGYKSVFREDTGDTLAVHTDSYSLISYEDAFEQFDRIVQESGLDITDLQIATDMSHNGARCFRQYLFPAISHTIDGRDDPIAFRIISFNSYDGTAALSFQSGFFRFVCANTCIIGQTAKKLSIKHTGNAMGRFVDGAREIVAASNTYLNEIERLRRWNTVELIPEQVEYAISQMPQMTKRLRDTFTADFSTGRMGRSTMWQLFNGLTAWATHVKDEGQRAATRAGREKRVAAVVSTPRWISVEKGEEMWREGVSDAVVA